MDRERSKLRMSADQTKRTPKGTSDPNNSTTRRTPKWRDEYNTSSQMFTKRADPNRSNEKSQLFRSIGVDAQVKRSLFGPEADTNPKSSFRLGSEFYGPQNLLALHDKRVSELQSFTFLTRSHLKMIEKYKKREEEACKLQVNEENFIEKKQKEYLSFNPNYQKKKMEGTNAKATMIQKHFKGYRVRMIWRPMLFHTVNTNLLWRAFRFLSVYKSDKYQSKEMFLIIITLSSDETYILIRVKACEKAKSEWISLKIFVKELIEYYEIEPSNKTILDGARKSREKLNNIKNFTGCFLDSLYIDDKTLKFNQRKKLQKLIELLNEDSVLNLDESEVDSKDNVNESISLASGAEMALKKNNYEQYLDTITTRVQKMVKGWLTRIHFERKVAQESIKVLQVAINQDGEDILYILMKRLHNGYLTAYAFNYSTGKYFHPDFIGKGPSKQEIKPEGAKEVDVYERIFDKTIIDLESDRMISLDFYFNTKESDQDTFEPTLMDQRAKIDRYVELYRLKKHDTFKKRGFRLESRYTLNGKKFIIYQGVPINIMLFTCIEGKTIRLDCIRMDTRQLFCSKVFHVLGDAAVTTLTEGKRIYEGMQLVGDLDNGFDIQYESKGLEVLETDFGDRQMARILSIQRHFKQTKIKESFRYARGSTDYLIEIYYLKTIGKFLIKILDEIKPEDNKKDPNVIYSTTKYQPKSAMQEERQMRIAQMITVESGELKLPPEPLGDKDTTKLVNLIIFNKLRPANDKFILELPTQEEISELLAADAKEQSIGKRSSLAERVRSELGYEKRGATFSEAYQDLESGSVDKSPRNRREDTQNSIELFPSLHWEFGLENIPQRPEEDEQMTPVGSTFRAGAINPKEYKPFSKIHTMKPKIFSIISMNSLYEKKRRTTSPVQKSNQGEHSSKEKFEGRDGKRMKTSSKAVEEGPEELMDERKAERRLTQISVSSRGTGGRLRISPKGEFRVRDSPIPNSTLTKKSNLRKSLVLPSRVQNDDEGIGLNLDEKLKESPQKLNSPPQSEAKPFFKIKKAESQASAEVKDKVSETSKDQNGELKAAVDHQLSEFQSGVLPESPHIASAKMHSPTNQRQRFRTDKSVNEKRNTLLRLHNAQHDGTVVGSKRSIQSKDNPAAHHREYVRKASAFKKQTTKPSLKTLDRDKKAQDKMVKQKMPIALPPEFGLNNESDIMNEKDIEGQTPQRSEGLDIGDESKSSISIPDYIPKETSKSSKKPGLDMTHPLGISKISSSKSRSSDRS